jgi:hypothetical protein
MLIYQPLILPGVPSEQVSPEEMVRRVEYWNEQGYRTDIRGYRTPEGKPEFCVIIRDKEGEDGQVYGVIYK